jgi:hypothetical protein
MLSKGMLWPKKAAQTCGESDLWPGTTGVLAVAPRFYAASSKRWKIAGCWPP